MNILRITISAVFILMMSYGVSSAQLALLIAADSDDGCTTAQGGDLSSLYIVNPQTGASNLIGPIGFRSVSGMAVLGDGRLVGSAIADANGDRISILIEINPFTGQGTLIGTIGNNNVSGCGRVPDLTYDAATDSLYGIGFRCIPGDDHGSITELLHINQTTGLGTTIGQTGFFGGGNGLAIRDDGTLFSYASDDFITLSPQTGQGTLVANNPLIEIVMAAMDFHPLTGELFGIEFGFQPFDPLLTPTHLVTVDTSNALLARIGELPACSDALVFITLSRNIPTLSEWGLIAMAAILGIVGFMVMRRRKVTA